MWVRRGCDHFPCCSQLHIITNNYVPIIYYLSSINSSLCISAYTTCINNAVIHGKTNYSQFSVICRLRKHLDEYDVIFSIGSFKMSVKCGSPSCVPRKTLYVNVWMPLLFDCILYFIFSVVLFILYVFVCNFGVYSFVYL